MCVCSCVCVCYVCHATFMSIYNIITLCTFLKSLLHMTNCRCTNFGLCTNSSIPSRLKCKERPHQLKPATLYHKTTLVLVSKHS